VAVSADGQWLAAGTAIENERGAEKPGISLWRTGQTGGPEVEIELSASTWEMAFSPNGRELVCLAQDGSLETWRADTGEFENDQFVELSENPNGLAYSDNGGLLAVGTEDVVEIYRPSLEPLVTIRPQLGEINAVAFDPNAMLAISGEALRIQLWQIRPVQNSSWELLGHASPAIILRFCPSHPTLAAVTEHGQVLLWDVNEGPETPRPLGGEMSSVEALAFSPDGSVLACGDDAGSVWLWNWQAETIVARIENGSPVTTLAFAPNGSQLLAGSEDGRVRVYKIR
jgi:WD40 repeat protein